MRRIYNPLEVEEIPLDRDIMDNMLVFYMTIAKSAEETIDKIKCEIAMVMIDVEDAEDEELLELSKKLRISKEEFLRFGGYDVGLNHLKLEIMNIFRKKEVIKESKE